MAAHLCSYNAGHVLHHFMLQESCLLGSGALPGRYGFLFLFLTPSAPLESSSAGSRSRLESDFVSQSRSSASVRGREEMISDSPAAENTPVRPLKTVTGSVSSKPHSKARYSPDWTSTAQVSRVNIFLLNVHWSKQTKDYYSKQVKFKLVTLSTC